MHVLVAGGGVVGCSLAFYLRGAGVDVTLIERSHIASGASSAAAGMLAPLAESHEPGPFTHLALQGLAAFDSDAERIIAESGIDFEFRRDGILRVAENEAEAIELRGLLPAQTQNGHQAEWLDPPALHRLEPALAPGIAGALYTPREGHVNPTRLTAALATAAARRGARILEGTALEGFERVGAHVAAVRAGATTIPVDHVILAGGAWLGTALTPLGAGLPVTPVRGQMVALAATPPPVRSVIYSHDGYLVPKADGSIFAGATEEHDAGFDPTVTAAGLHWLLGAATRLVPCLAGAAYVRSWAGLRPGTPDNLPILGPLPGFENVSVAAGHYRNGILLSLITGRLLTQFLTTGSLPAELQPFSASRFTA